ncbi:MAG: alpha-L-rhamnosidase [Planctomycetes bacterium]|nr:alpha-L-rhamnosidase [Planctomycetota bacterium]
MSGAPIHWRGRWIWAEGELPSRNAFVAFRRRFPCEGGPATLHVTADSRYVAWFNGVWLGSGPVRCWPGHWRYDTYDLTPWLRKDDNVLAVLVNHYGEGTFQYIAGPPGLLAQIEMPGATIMTSPSWRAAAAPGYVTAAPRISVQEAFEEQFDARQAEPWTQLDFDDRSWPAAVDLRGPYAGPHFGLAPRDIPFLTQEPVLPKRLVSVEAVRSVPYRFTIYAKPYVAPSDHSSNFVFAHYYLATQVWSRRNARVTFHIPHKHPGPLKVNGKLAEGDRATLKAGWNTLVARADAHHLPEFVIALDGPPGLRFSAWGDVLFGTPWAVVGPFELREDQKRQAAEHMDASAVLVGPMSNTATCEAGEAFWESCDVAAQHPHRYFQGVRPEHLPEANAFVQAATDRVVPGDVRVENADGLGSGSDWTTVHPTADGSDVRLLLDFGHELIGPHAFEVAAPEGTILDFHNFEFIQPDGRHNLAEGMNNSLRYICREGIQSYRSIVRRGFQYSYLILRNMTGPVKLRGVHALFSSYPQSRRGSFACSDAQLDRIWQAGALTLRCCAEDTYTDCPTYEQTHWVGDARNEALIDWAVNGDPRLWFHCLEQTGHSLDRSAVTESHVPSAWQNVLTAWSLLWMRSCREYVLFTGDRERGLALLDFVRRNVEGLAKHINAQGLLDIRAWNMFDWAPMDTPSRGVVTHQNCQLVHALRDAAELATWLRKATLARSWRKMAAALSDAINAHLWSDEKQAYTDCLRDGKHSPVFSQQTQTAAYIAGVARGARGRRCWEIVQTPPEGFVRAGSPFFEFFLLEGYLREGRHQDFLDTVRRDWGRMIDLGATTFWETWSSTSDRLTRSHCHAWSAAPTFFLSTHVLGVRPGGPGFEPVLVEPHPCGLTWCRGTMPTPRGDVEVQWENEDGKPFALRVRAPEALAIRAVLPREGTFLLNGRLQETGRG